MNLPYSGYSWQITQHEIGFDPGTIYSLLSCASYFEGQANAGTRITQLMLEANLLTANVRDGHADAWRDYQQILPELGLMYSTRVEPKITFTQAGRMYITGAIGFSELILIQSLRLQYPNGHKSQVSPRIRRILEDQNKTVPETMGEIQSSYGVLIKPGLLILRTLLSLHQHHQSPSISIEECLAFLLPLKTNSEWDLGVASIMDARKKATVISHDNSHARRNIAAWFKMLSKSEAFLIKGGSLHLSSYALANLDRLSLFCEEEENPRSFWIAPNFDRDTRKSWFAHYGTIPFYAQSLLYQSIDDVAYVEENYVGGLAEETDEESFIPFSVRAPNIILSDVSHRNSTAGTSMLSPEQALRNMRLGAVRRQAKTAFHDDIVNELATKFRLQGAEVSEDRNSVDLLVKWPDKSAAIFEVKTGSKRNLQGRMRLAVGQLLEYSYRLNTVENIHVERVAVFDLDIPPDSWQVTYLNDHLDVGLISRQKQGYAGFHNTGSLTQRYWQSISI